MYYKVMYYIQYRNEGIPAEIVPQTCPSSGYLGETIENNLNVFT